MRLYPDAPRPLRSTIIRDSLCLTALLAAAWLGMQAHGVVSSLTAVSDGVRGAGTALQDGFDSAAESIDDAPVVGEDLSDGLHDAGESSGGRLVESADRQHDRIERAALVFGLLTGTLFALVPLIIYLPWRIRLVRRLTTAVRLLADPDGSDERRRVLAMRAAFALPFDTLLQYTSDPLGDLAAGRHDALVRALYEDAGLRVPQPVG